MTLATVVRGALGKKGVGWKPNAADERDRVFVAPASSRSPARRPRLVSMLEPATIFDQGATGSCVAQAIAGAIATREMWLSQQMPLSRPRSDLFSAATYGHLSRRALYSIARATHGAHKQDDGTYIRAALSMLRRHGCPLESDFSWSVRKINDSVPFAALHSGYAFAGLQYEAIFAGGDDKLGQIRAALREGLPVVFGTQVTRSFQQYSGGVYAPSQGEVSVGGHAMYIAAIDGGGNCTIVNSWGRGWGDDGRALVAADWVARSFRDLTIIKGWRRVQAAEKEVARVAA